MSIDRSFLLWICNFVEQLLSSMTFFDKLMHPIRDGLLSWLFISRNGRKGWQEQDLHRFRLFQVLNASRPWLVKRNERTSILTILDVESRHLKELIGVDMELDVFLLRIDHFG